MGCTASKPAPAPTNLFTDDASFSFASKRRRQTSAMALPEFEMSSPMIVMPFHAFKAEGRIAKSTKAWRDTALEEGRLVVYAKVEGGSGKVHGTGHMDGTVVIEDEGLIVIFISHRWWELNFKDATNDPENPADKGAPDWQKNSRWHPLNADRKKQDWLGLTPLRPPEKDLKWKIICKGVERLIETKGWRAKKVAIWMDWFSIVQDQRAEKLDGIMSLIKYATLCEAMLVPTEEEAFGLYNGAKDSLDIPGYGVRSWCRLENFVFSKWAQLRSMDVPLYAISRNGTLQHYPSMDIYDPSELPSGGDLANPDDRAYVKVLEDVMISVHGKYAAVAKCKEGATTRKVNLSRKLIRYEHVDVLLEQVKLHKIQVLDLKDNDLGDDGVKKLAAQLRSRASTLVDLKYVAHPLPTCCVLCGCDFARPLAGQSKQQRPHRSRCEASYLGS